MARFDVYKLKAYNKGLVLDVQADLLSHLDTRVVVPLITYLQNTHEPLPRLKPVFKIEKKSYVMLPTDIATILAGDLGKPIANLESRYRHDIIDALDFLFQGF
jgi:toxin CcdB